MNICISRAEAFLSLSLSLPLAINLYFSYMYFAHDFYHDDDDDDDGLFHVEDNPSHSNERVSFSQFRFLKHSP